MKKVLTVVVVAVALMLYGNYCALCFVAPLDQEDLEWRRLEVVQDFLTTAYVHSLFLQASTVEDIPELYWGVFEDHDTGCSYFIWRIGGKLTVKRI